MAVSQTAEYALRAVIRLADHFGAAQTTQQLAEATHVSPSYLPKVLQPLIRAGIISAQRGVHGGYRLESDPHALTVLDVVNCLDPIRRVGGCPMEIESHAHDLCSLHQLLDDTLRSTEERFAKMSIQDLLDSPDAPRPLCDSANPPENGEVSPPTGVVIDAVNNGTIAEDTKDRPLADTSP